MLSMGAPLFGRTLGVAGLGLFVGITFGIDVNQNNWVLT